MSRRWPLEATEAGEFGVERTPYRQHSRWDTSSVYGYGRRVEFTPPKAPLGFLDCVPVEEVKARVERQGPDLVVVLYHVPPFKHTAGPCPNLEEYEDFEDYRADYDEWNRRRMEELEASRRG